MKVRELLADQWGWVSTAGLFALVLLRVLMVARLDVTTAASLLAEGGFIQVTLSVALVLVPLVVSVVAGVLAVRLAVAHGVRRLYLIAGLLVLTAVIWHVAPWRTGAVVLAFVILAWLVSPFHDRILWALKVRLEAGMKKAGMGDELARAEARLRELAGEGKSLGEAATEMGGVFGRGHREASLLVGLLPALPLVPATIAALVSATPWMPAEEVTIRGAEPVVGYVVGSGPWVSVLREDDRRIARISSDAIVQRELCDLRAGQTWVSLAMRFGSPPAAGYPACSVAGEAGDS